MNNINDMVMSYEIITPDIAADILTRNTQNRHLSKATVDSYAKDMLMGNWDSRVGTSISIDKNGVLRDGAHRLHAVVQSGIPLVTWVCRNVSDTGVYDFGRPRNIKDQVMIERPELGARYRNHTVLAMIRVMLLKGSRDRVSPKQVMDYINRNQDKIDTFIDAISIEKVKKVTNALTMTSLYLAYLNGVELEKISVFWKILLEGWSELPEGRTVITYRNYLLSFKGSPDVIVPEISRCQKALKYFCDGKVVTKLYSSDSLIWDFVE